MFKITLVLLFAAVYVQCSKISDILLDELIEKYEEKRDDLDSRFCGSTPYECYRCPECHDHLQFGLCIKGATTARCLCKWGWTGKNAQRVPDAGVDKWSRNRIRADHCRKACHYTHDVWNQQCIVPPTCDDYECKMKCGKCIDDTCITQCNGKYETCVAGKCEPDCDPTDCALKCGVCENGQCIEKCNGKYEKCVAGVCKPDCDPLDCASKCGVCVKGKCVSQCKGLYKKCEAGKCVCDKPKCELDGGKCKEGVCKVRCCRNLLTSFPPFTGSSFKKYCDDRCEYVELKPGACPHPHVTTPCNPKCKESGGLCETSTGRCRCCEDFTGPHPRYTTSGLTATHCGVWCPHKRQDGSPNLLCVNPDYVERAEKNQNNAIIHDYPTYL